MVSDGRGRNIEKVTGIRLFFSLCDPEDSGRLGGMVAAHDSRAGDKVKISFFVGKAVRLLCIHASGIGRAGILKALQGFHPGKGKYVDVHSVAGDMLTGFDRSMIRVTY